MAHENHDPNDTGAKVEMSKEQQAFVSTYVELAGYSGVSTSIGATPEERQRVQVEHQDRILEMATEVATNPEMLDNKKFAELAAQIIFAVSQGHREDVDLYRIRREVSVNKGYRAIVELAITSVQLLHDEKNT